MPTEMIYEEDGMVFNLGEAQECLRATRETLHMFRDHTRSRSRSRDAASGSRNRPVVMVLVPPIPVFFASTRHLPPPNIWFTMLWLALGISSGIVPWTSCNHGYVSPSPLEGAELRAVSEPRTLLEPLSRLRSLRFNETSRCIHMEGSPPSANLYNAPLPTEGKMCLHCRASNVPRRDLPAEPMPNLHLCTRYRRATACSEWANPDIRQAAPLHAHALLTCLQLCAHYCILRTTCVACILVAVHRSAMCLYCPLMRWARAAIHCRPSEVQRSLISHSHVLPSLRLACLPGRSLALTAPSTTLATKRRLGPKSRGPSAMLYTALLLLLHSQSAAAVLRTEARVAPELLKMPLLGGHPMQGHRSQVTSLKLVVCHKTVWLTVVSSVHTCVLVVEQSSKAIPDTVVARSLLRRCPHNLPARSLIV